MKILATRFSLLRQLGRGASGSVWLALDHQTGNRPIACKLLHAESRSDARAINSLKREVLIARRLHHPNICQVFSFYEVEPEPFITMEYLEGQTLRSAAAESGAQVPRSRLEHWLQQIADALDYAHARQILHRDIKPSNVLCGHGEEVSLIDFGIASVLAEQDQTDHPASRVGTYLYMAPEVIHGRAPTPYSDQYSLAVMAYELLNGEHPSLAQRGWSSTGAAPSTGLNVDDAFKRALSEVPEERFEDCRSFVTALRGSSHDGDISVPPANRGRLLENPSEDSDTRDADWNRPLSSCLMLGEILRDNGLVTDDAIEGALRAQPGTGLSLGELLLDRGEVSARSLASAIAEQCRLEFVPLSDEAIDWAAARAIGMATLNRDVCIPIRGAAAGIRVAISDPLDFAALERIEATAAVPVEWCVASRDEILSALQQKPS